MEWPEVTVLICTYNRQAEIVKTVGVLADKLRYPNLKWLICDDASPDGYVGKLKRLKLFKDLGAEFVTTSQNSGWGANVNNGLSHVKSDFVFFTEDDKLIHKEIDLQVGMALMLSKPDVGMVRYKGTAGNHMVLHQFEAQVKDYLPEYQDGWGVPGYLTYLQLDSGSPTLHLYSHGTHLKRRSFHDFYGPYPVGLKLGPTEETYAHIVKSSMILPGAPAITILPEWVASYVEDIGQSFKGSEWDK